MLLDYDVTSEVPDTTNRLTENLKMLRMISSSVERSPKTMMLEVHLTGVGRAHSHTHINTHTYIEVTDLLLNI